MLPEVWNLIKSFLRRFRITTVRVLRQKPQGELKFCNCLRHLMEVPSSCLRIWDEKMRLVLETRRATGFFCFRNASQMLLYGKDKTLLLYEGSVCLGSLVRLPTQIYCFDCGLVTEKWTRNPSLELLLCQPGTMPTPVNISFLLAQCPPKCYVKQVLYCDGTLVILFVFLKQLVSGFSYSLQTHETHSQTTLVRLVQHSLFVPDCLLVTFRNLLFQERNTGTVFHLDTVTDSVIHRIETAPGPGSLYSLSQSGCVVLAVASGLWILDFNIGTCFQNDSFQDSPIESVYTESESRPGIFRICVSDSKTQRILEYGL